MTPDLSPSLLVSVAAVIFLAGAVRGATGFGFSLIMVTTLTLAFPPSAAVPVTILWEIAAGCLHLPFIRRDVDWKSLRWICPGILAGTPVGVFLLASLPIRPMCLAINAVVFALTLMLLSGMRPRRMPGAAAALGIGAAGGLINGASAAGGPPIVLFYAVGHGAAAGRASMTALFLITDALAAILMLRGGLISRDVLVFAAVFAPFMLAGMFCGHRLFSRIREDTLRRITQILLLILAGSGVLGAISGPM